MQKEIPEGQLCESFDPMMIFPEKTDGIVKKGAPNTSCFAPAFVYLEGTRGKRFLCDFHYEYERSITVARTPELWPKISKVFIDERERIRDTFAIPKQNFRTVFGTCWCGYEGFVRLDGSKNNEETKEFCNFHYRKLLYRHLSNNSILEDIYTIIDDRHFMSDTIAEEAEKLPTL
jgi:hypothetical protein